MLDIVRELRQPRVALIFAQGFSSGLPFFLTAGTLAYWLRQEHTSLSAIGFISWVGLAYSFKFIWAPIIDRIKLPFIGSLGRRRGWMALTQVLVGLGILAMALTGPGAGLMVFGATALFVAFTAASQDIVVDAFRIEWADNPDELGLFTGAFQLGYRIAVVVATGPIYSVGKHFGWQTAYVVMAALMVVGFFATLRVSEPAAAARVMDAKAPLWTPQGFVDGTIGPFVSFFRTYAWVGIPMILLIALYRLPEYLVGQMITPLYSDLKVDADMISAVRSSVGLVFSLLGVAFGGVLALRVGYLQTLIIGGILQALAEASFAIFAFAHHVGPTLFSVVNAFDTFGVAVAGVALVTYMSSLTTLGYTATQYAFLTSVFAMLGKVFKGLSGLFIDGVQHAGYSLMDAYAIFFIGSGLIGIPSILLCFWLLTMKRQPQAQPSVARAPSS
jgi:PAT family beta-lactamase induction signal transducer AmpG